MATRKNKGVTRKKPMTEREKFLKKYGITEQISSNTGFNPKSRKWFGWSHRAIYGFGIGSKIKKGDCGYNPKKGEWTARTLADAKKMAQEFAESVS